MSIWAFKSLNTWKLNPLFVMRQGRIVHVILLSALDAHSLPDILEDCVIFQIEAMIEFNVLFRYTAIIILNI